MITVNENVIKIETYWNVNSFDDAIAAKYSD